MRLHAMAACARWIAAFGDARVDTHGALTFVGPVAWSYAEPIGVLIGETGALHVTTGRFSVTTSKHTGQITRAAEAAGLPVREIAHGTLRGVVRDHFAQGCLLGPRGRHLERVGVVESAVIAA